MALTLEQQTVINSDAKKILVLSCAGSGKTTVIVNRITKLWKNGVKPEEILALTFSNKAAQEMKKRITKEDSKLGIKTNIKTFHAFGLEIIRQYSPTIGFEKNVKIAKGNDIQYIFKEIFRKRGEDPIAGDALVNYLKTSKSFETYQHIQYYDAILSEYSKIMKERCLVDMDDMIFIPVNLLSENSNIRTIISEKYKYIFVDEYQDTNEAQNKLLDLIITNNTNVCLVGDDDQAIYEWRGARPDYIRKKASSGEYECIKLEKNFRSQAEIINVANRIISKNNNRVQKAIISFRPKGLKPIFKWLPSEEKESDWVADKIEELISSNRFNPSDIAVLYRNNSQGDFIKKALKQRNIESENMELDDNARYSTFINVLQSIVDLSSISDMSEALNFPTRCFDQFSFDDAKGAYCDLYGQDCNFETMEWINKIYLSDVDFDGSVEFRERYAIITQLHEAKDWGPTKVIACYLSYMERKGYDKTQQEKFNYVLQAFDIAKNYEEVFAKKSLKEFLDHLAISYETNDVNRTTNIEAVNLMTMHRSKGLEFKVVFLIGVQVGCIPNDYFIQCIDDLEAERRLFYVAITRAKELLYLSSFKDPFGGSFKSSCIHNGFMAEIPETALGIAPSRSELVNLFPLKDEVINEKITPKDVDKVIENVTKTVKKDAEEVIKFDKEVDLNKNEILENNYNEKDKISSFSKLTEEQVSKYFEESFALSKNIEIPRKYFIVIIGNLEMKQKIAKAILKGNSFEYDQVEYYDYNGKGFNIKKYFNNHRCIGIIMGPNAHKIQTVDSKSLKTQLINNPGYPFFVDLIEKRITKQSLQEAITKIKWNYCREKDELNN